MLTPTHLAGGYILLSSTRKAYADDTSNVNRARWLLLLGLLLSVGIDIDAWWSPGGTATHHMSLLHYPIFWIGVFLVLFLIGIFLKATLVRSIAVVVLMSSLFHLFLDTFGVTIGIYWLWPFSTQEFSFLPLHPPFDSFMEWLKYYIAQPLMFFEVAIMLLGVGKWFLDRARSKSQPNSAR